MLLADQLCEQSTFIINERLKSGYIAVIDGAKYAAGEGLFSYTWRNSVFDETLIRFLVDKLKNDGFNTSYFRTANGWEVTISWLKSNDKISKA
jgi:hypothetical protein